MRSLAGVLLASLVALALVLAACGQANPAPVARPSDQPAGAVATAPASVQVAAVQRGALSSTLSYSGNVQARQQVSLVPKVAGRVTKLAVDVGSAVKAGDTLLVPKSAVVQDYRDTVVYSVAEGRVKRQVVTTGATDGDQIEIVAGLVTGQQVAVPGLSGLRDGAEVTVQ